MEAEKKLDFPVTERALDKLDEWLTELAAPLVPLKKIPAGPPGSDGFRWAFREKTERSLVIGKSVRMISAIRAAFILADLGYVTECGTLLRTVSDFSNEIFSICEGVRSGNPTEAQKLFVDNISGRFPKIPTNMMLKKESNLSRAINC